MKEVPSAIFAVAFHPEGKLVAGGGFDGQVLLYDPETGQLQHRFVPIQIAGLTSEPATSANPTGAVEVTATDAK